MIDKKYFADSKFKIKILIYLMIFVVVYGVCNTSIYYSKLMPFGVGMIFALLYADFNGYLLSIIYLLAYSLSGFKLQSIVEALNVSLIVLLITYLKSNKNYIIKKWHLYLFYMISQLMFFFLNFSDVKTILALFVSIILGELFLYTSLCFVDATIKRGMFIKLNIDEKICGSVILIIFILGMSYCNIYILNLGMIFVSFIILLSTFVNNSSHTMIISSIMGISFAIARSNPGFISLFLLMSILAISFKSNYKFLSIFATLVGYFLYNLFFGFEFAYGEIFSICLGLLIFAFIPLKFLNSISKVFETKSQVMFKNIVNKSKTLIIDRVQKLSNVFKEMDIVYRDMVKGVLPREKAIDVLKTELISSVCYNCPNRDICHRGELEFLDNSIFNIVSTAYDKGKVLLMDLPSYLTTNCSKINQLITTLNSLVDNYNEYTMSINNLDSSRILIAEQLNGVSKLLYSLSKELDTNISLDDSFQKRIIEELSYKNIICLETAVYIKDINNKTITLIVKTDTIKEKTIERITSKILNNKLYIVSIEPTDIVGASLITLAVKANYDIVFGSSNINKFGKRISGDSHSLIKIDEGKYMLSICDGMGSGENAHNISNLTISLIENFYRAGFENDIILSSINKLLSLTEDENYSTIDLCLIDAKKNVYDFIKLGATSGFLKRDHGECEEIKGSNLPVGVLEDISPHIIKKLINPFDMIILVSDGITDSFENKYDLRLFIAGLDIINPQTLSEKILDKAMELSDNIPKDDMTVLCVRVFNNV